MHALAMDQGLAAVLGAGVGVIGAVGAAGLTFLGVRHQVRETAKNERLRTARAERVEAYTALTAAAMEAVEAITNLRVSLQAEHDDPSIGPDGDVVEGVAETLVSRIDTAANSVQEASRCAAKILVLGPMPAAQAAHELVGSARSAFYEVTHAYSSGSPEPGWEDRHEASMAALAEALGAFAGGAGALVGDS
ncbi:hypothetical protein [Streptomyces sp. Da 82-17]|uniref:hypothetical protein n=1 Tax=Streptomyces sp. Da 82-17 TaxID=3377116 RepID=UPI0038D44728